MKRPAAFYWSMRRELWENRFIYVVPLIVAAVVLLGFTAHLFGKPAGTSMRAIAMPYSLAASVILFSCWIIAFMYASDALTGERRDRSILFWKSMPVSDFTTVASKVTIALVALPLIGCAVAFATQLLMFATLSVVTRQGGDFWAPLGILLDMAPIMFYGMAIHALWFAPIVGYLLLVSAWARRAALLWAVVPPFAIFAFEYFALGTSSFAVALRYRFVGAMVEGFTRDALKTHITQVSQLDPVRFFTSRNLWLGLAFAAACIALAILVRRRREPN